MFITNNHASLYLFWKVKFGKVARILKKLCPLLSVEVSFALYVFTPNVWNSHFLVGVYFIFLKKRRYANLKVFQFGIYTSMKRSEKESSIRTKFTFSCKVVVAILGWNCVKSIIVTKIVLKNQVWSRVDRVWSKNCF